MLLQTNARFLCNEKYCPVEFFPSIIRTFHQEGILYMLGANSFRGAASLLFEEILVTFSVPSIV